MNKTEFVAKVAAKAQLSKTDAAKATDAMLDTIISELAAGGKVQILGFGTFETRHRPERDGINPQTKETVKIAARKVPSFKPGKSFKSLINQ